MRHGPWSSEEARAAFEKIFGSAGEERTKAVSYTDRQLQEMARSALAARDSEDPRWYQLVTRLIQHFQCDLQTVASQIEQLATY